MRVVLFCNGSVGAQVAAFLGKRKDAEVVALVIHPKNRRRNGDEILRALRLPPSRVFDGSKVNTPSVRAAIAALKPDMGVSAYFVYILKKEILDIFPRGCVNLHPAYLPWNKGTNTNIWSLVEGTPAGVTLHQIDVGVDTGAVLAQKKVKVEPIDTGKTLYARLEKEAVALFRASWGKLVQGKLHPKPQKTQAGTRHRFRDVDVLDDLEGKKTYTAGELIDILRARTFPPYTGAYIRRGGKKVYIRVSLSYE